MRTRARISDTICTPLLREAVAGGIAVVLELLAIGSLMLRVLIVGLGVGVDIGSLDGEYDASVVDRVRPGFDPFGGVVDVHCDGKPARLSKAD